MLSDSQRREVAHRLLILQLISLGMIGGSIAFGAIVALMADWSVVGRPFKIFNLLAGGTGMLMYVLAFLVPTMFPRTPDQVPPPSQGSDPDEELENRAIRGIVSLLTTETTIRYALLEGAIFLNIMVLMLEPRWFTVGVIAFGLALMLVCFPLRFRSLATLESRLERWRRGEFN